MKVDHWFKRDLVVAWIPEPKQGWQKNAIQQLKVSLAQGK